MAKLTCDPAGNSRMSREDLQQWCDRQNATRLAKECDWWFYLGALPDGRLEVRRHEGWRAIEERARAAGRLSATT